jgi:hypothetical protein
MHLAIIGYVICCSMQLYRAYSEAQTCKGSPQVYWRLQQWLVEWPLCWKLLSRLPGFKGRNYSKAMDPVQLWVAQIRGVDDCLSSRFSLSRNSEQLETRAAGISEEAVGISEQLVVITTFIKYELPKSWYSEEPVNPNSRYFRGVGIPRSQYFWRVGISEELVFQGVGIPRSWYSLSILRLRPVKEAPRLIGDSIDGLLNGRCVGSFYHGCQVLRVEIIPKPWILSNCESHKYGEWMIVCHRNFH